MSSNSAGPARAQAYRIAFLVVAVIGACLSADLIRLHVRVYTDPDFSSFCAMSEGVNCETVALSDYSVALGLPLAVWGFIAYLAIAGLAVWGMRNRRTATWPFGSLFWITALAAAQGSVLFAISHFVIHSVCIVCMGTYAVNFALWALSYAVLRRLGSGPIAGLAGEVRAFRTAPGDVLWFATGLVVVVVALLFTVPAYWRPDAVEIEAHGMPTGHTDDGHPWIGSAQPALEIVEYSDYQCPHCRRAHYALRKLIKESGAEIRLVHRHYPLDDACNPLLEERFHARACEYSLLAYCADQQSKFWEANDYLFANGGRRSPIQSKELAHALGMNERDLATCARGDDARLALRSDIATGNELGISGTPTFVVGERVFLGHVPAEVIRPALERAQ